MDKINRRDFIKLATILSAGASLPTGVFRLLESRAGKAPSPPNFIVFVFDAMTARDLSVYGFPRETTPNFEKFANHSYVYHSHYSAGNFTIPGTASLLTGMYPWTHRAINESGQVLSRYAKRNIFHLIGDEYNRYAYGQNAWADLFLNEFAADLDRHIPIQRGFMSLINRGHAPMTKRLY